MYKNIIFDFDGVIINSHDIQVKALTESFKAICGEGTPPYDDFFKLSGEGLKNIFTQLGLPLEMIPIYQMIELLEKLIESGRFCALCTGKDRSRTIEILKHFKIEHFFKIVVCSDDVINPKPHPESLMLIIDDLNATLEDTVIVGDGINDMLSAKNADIKSIAVTWGDVPEKSLKDCKPDRICYSITQLKNILL